ncbi:MAG TPA: hexameric tyrosine-coordinated heme protein [Flavobacteriaceae bacterium]|nr:hexameric tyrosine-coordinated heme protein [Flavobacteriaceae bacterium]
MKRIIMVLTFMLFIGIPLNALAQDATDSSTPTEKLEGIVQKMDSQNKIKKQNPTEQGEVWLKTLLTDTPQEGRELAIKMARKSIAAVQTDPEVRKKLRKDYAEDTAQLINIASVIALEFQTIAAANNYWK